MTRRKACSLLAAPLQASWLQSHATVVAFGDSLTAPRKGVVTYCEQLVVLLAEHDRKVQIINSGVPGNTSADARLRFATDVLAHRPAVTIIQLGANDAAINVWESPPATKPRVDLPTFRNNLEYFVRTLRGRNSQVILMTPNRFAWTPRLRELYGKAPYDVRSDDGFNVTMNAYSDAVRSIARRQQITLVDAAKLVPASALLDGMHPNTEGHRIVALHLLPVLRSLLAI